MEVTKADERNIRYFARQYACNEAPYDDLYQEGYLGALKAKKPEHKYLAIKSSIQEAKRKARRCATSPYLDSKAKEEDPFAEFENKDHVQTLFKNTEFNGKEAEVLHRYFFLNQDPLEIWEAVGVKKTQFYKLLKNAVNKLEETERSTAYDG